MFTMCKDSFSSTQVTLSSLRWPSGVKSQYLFSNYQIQQPISKEHSLGDIACDLLTAWCLALHICQTERRITARYLPAILQDLMRQEPDLHGESIIPSAEVMLFVRCCSTKGNKVLCRHYKQLGFYFSTYLHLILQISMPTL